MCLLWGAGTAGGNGSRPGLFRYLNADETAGYLAIMAGNGPSVDQTALGPAGS